jgi:Tol biopolymer transport system component
MGVFDIASGTKLKLQPKQVNNPTNPPNIVGWSPDGKFLLFGGGRPQIMDVATGTSWPLLAPNVALSWDRTGSWSPDGTFIVLGDRSESFDWRQWSGLNKK